ncbi:MAG TPA: hypothetical protein VKZ98_04575 [Aquaticitalea sp.]|nr:hypothetical protein [Aquaticitalea sp.]
MKEYKVESRPYAFSNNNKKFEDFLNQQALQGWHVMHIASNMSTIVFEREKNR